MPGGRAFARWSQRLTASSWSRKYLARAGILSPYWVFVLRFLTAGGGVGVGLAELMMARADARASICTRVDAARLNWLLRSSDAKVHP